MIPIGYEVNFDGIIGPTHNYSGLSYGNTASMNAKGKISNPKKAALQGLTKMKLLHDLGLKQGIIPPHERPHLPTLKALGFTGSDRLIPEKVYSTQPGLLYNATSAAYAWAANSCHITPSIDSTDNKVHITPANLASKPHRCIESDFTAELLKIIFPETVFFDHAPPLPMRPIFLDEGAANHLRFSTKHMQQGVHVFVYGTTTMTLKGDIINPKKFPARQSQEASKALARSHKIFPDRVHFVKQNPAAIDKGVFHNDIISTSNEYLFFYHEDSFVDTPSAIKKIRTIVEEHIDRDMFLIEVTNDKIPLEKAINTYLFNSQIVTLPDQSMALIAPHECRLDNDVFFFLDHLSKDPDNPIRDLHFFNIHESMQNGGGPACLRIRAQLNQNEFNALNPNMILTIKLYDKLVAWVDKHYRERLTPDDLKDPDLIDETHSALDELTKILDLGSIYSFQL